MSREGVALLIAVATVVCGCGGAGGGSSAGSSSAFANHPPFLLATPHPRTVAVDLDAGHAAKADIPMTGGSLSATGADGTVFDLTIPDKALAGGDTVTMTPVTAMHGAPLSVGPMEAVQIEPDGLLLFAAATLTITPKAQLAPAYNRVGFGYTGTGNDFHLEPLDATGATTLHLTHFSGYGVGGATPQDSQQQAQTPPPQPWDQEAQFLQQAAQQVISDAHNRAVNQGEGSVDSAALHSALQGISEQYWKNVVQPLLEAAKSDPSLTDKAILTAVQYERKDELVVSSGRHGDEVFAQIRNLVAKQAEQLKCDLARADKTIADYFGVVRKSQLLGGQTGSAISIDTRKCMRFRLDFTSDATIFYNGCMLDYHMEEKGLLLEPDAYRGQTTLTFSSNNTACDYGFTGFAQTQPFSVNELRFDIDVKISTAAGSIPKISISHVLLFMRPGQATASLYLGSPDNIAADNVPLIDCGPVGYCWTGDHAAHRVPPAGDFIIYDWTYPGSGLVFAVAKDSGEVDDSTLGVISHDTSTYTLTMSPA